MKKLAYVSFLLLAAIVTAPPAKAEDAGDKPQKMEQHMKKRNEEKLKTMTKKLGLSADQQTAVKAALDSQSDKMSGVHKDFADKMKSIHDETDQQITAVLNEDQKKKYAEMKSDMKTKHKKLDWDKRKDKNEAPEK